MAGGGCLYTANLPVSPARSNKSGSSVVIRSELKKPTAIDATLRHDMDGGPAAEPQAWMAAAARRWLENAGATAEDAPGRAFNALPLSGVRVSLAERGRALCSLRVPPQLTVRASPTLPPSFLPCSPGPAELSRDKFLAWL